MQKMSVVPQSSATCYTYNITATFSNTIVEINSYVRRTCSGIAFDRSVPFSVATLDRSVPLSVATLDRSVPLSVETEAASPSSSLITNWSSSICAHRVGIRLLRLRLLLVLTRPSESPGVVRPPLQPSLRGSETAGDAGEHWSSCSCSRGNFTGDGISGPSCSGPSCSRGST